MIHTKIHLISLECPWIMQNHGLNTILFVSFGKDIGDPALLEVFYGSNSPFLHVWAMTLHYFFQTMASHYAQIGSLSSFYTNGQKALWHNFRRLCFHAKSWTSFKWPSEWGFWILSLFIWGVNQMNCNNIYSAIIIWVLNFLWGLWPSKC